MLYLIVLSFRQLSSSLVLTLYILRSLNPLYFNVVKDRYILRLVTTASIPGGIVFTTSG